MEAPCFTGDSAAARRKSSPAPTVMAAAAASLSASKRQTFLNNIKKVIAPTGNPGGRQDSKKWEISLRYSTVLFGF